MLQLATCHLSYYIIVVATFTTKPAGPGPACCNRPIINNIFTQLLNTYVTDIHYFFLPFLRLLQHMLQLATCHLSYYINVVATFTTKPAGPGLACCNRPIINNIFTQLLSTYVTDIYYFFPTFLPPSSGCCNTCCNLPLAIYPIILLLLQHLLPNLPGPGLPVATIPLLIIYLHNYLVHNLRIIFFFPTSPQAVATHVATCHLPFILLYYCCCNIYYQTCRALACLVIATELRLGGSTYLIFKCQNKAVLS